MTALRQRFLAVRGHRVRVLDGGAGRRLVVLLASPLIHAGLYRRTAAAFSPSARIVVVDLPGCGRSSRLTPPLGMDALADLVPELLQALGARSAVLIGHSNSGAIALHAAVRHPSWVSTLVLADSVGAHPRRSLLPVLAGRTVDACIELRLTLVGWTAIAWNLVWHTRSFLGQLRSAAGDGLLPVASQVEVPVLLAWGRRDHTMPLIAAERFRQAMPHARLVISDTGSHDWIIEESGRFAAAVLAET